MTYRFSLTRDTNDTWLVTFPDVPGAHTFGETKEEARLRALDALESMLEAHIKDGDTIPRSKPATKSQETLTVPPMIAAKVELYEALRGAKMTKYALAKRLNWHVPQVDCLFNLRHRSRLDQIEEAAAALGRRVELRVVA